MLEIKKLSKTYTSGAKSVQVLKNIDFAIGAGDIVSIVGPSGSGKTTLLGLCAGLDKASTGSVRLNGVALEPLTSWRSLIKTVGAKVIKQQSGELFHLYKVRWPSVG